MEDRQAGFRGETGKREDAHPLKKEATEERDTFPYRFLEGGTQKRLSE